MTTEVTSDVPWMTGVGGGSTTRPEMTTDPWMIRGEKDGARYVGDLGGRPNMEIQGNIWLVTKTHTDYIPY